MALRPFVTTKLSRKMLFTMTDPDINATTKITGAELKRANGSTEAVFDWDLIRVGKNGKLHFRLTKTMPLKQPAVPKASAPGDPEEGTIVVTVETTVGTQQKSFAYTAPVSYVED
jgi:hypothetical protein